MKITRLQEILAHTLAKIGDVEVLFSNDIMERRVTFGYGEEGRHNEMLTVTILDTHMHTDEQNRFHIPIRVVERAVPDPIETLRSLATAAARIVEDDAKPTLPHMRELNRCRQAAIKSLEYHDTSHKTP